MENLCLVAVGLIRIKRPLLSNLSVALMFRLRFLPVLFIFLLCSRVALSADNVFNFGRSDDNLSGASPRGAEYPDESVELRDVTSPAENNLRKPFRASGVYIRTIPKHEEIKNNNLVILRGLNKIMGYALKFDLPLGTVYRFDNLEIIAHKCWKTIYDDYEDNAVLLEIREIKVGESPKRVFSGWMFSHSPSISNLEHPFYDITVLSCEYKKDLEVR
ncbi:MAG: DUF2155 domain-containing protein [Rickettsiales bacterium]